MAAATGYVSSVPCAAWAPFIDGALRRTTQTTEQARSMALFHVKLYTAKRRRDPKTMRLDR